MTKNAAILADLINSGDVDSASTYFEGWCSARVWSPTEQRAIRSACGTWGVDARRFGVAPRPAPPAWALPLRASLTLDAVPMAPTGEDFQCAAMQAERSDEHLWRFAAIRWRQRHPFAQMDLGAVEVERAGLAAMYARRAGVSA